MGVFVNIAENQAEVFDIQFQLSPNGAITDLSEIEEGLYRDIEFTNNRIKSLKHTKKEVKRKYFDKLLTLSQSGFISTAANPNVAQISLEVLKTEMLLVEGTRIKNKYMLYLGVGAACSIGLSWIMFCIFAEFFDVMPLKKYFIVWSGAMVGTWISFGARKFIIQFEELSELEKDNMHIYIRLPYIGVCALIFLLFIGSGIFSFEIGSLSTEKLDENPKIQLLIGVIAGLLESKLGISIYEKAEGMAARM